MAKRTSRSEANETTVGAPVEPKPKARSHSSVVGAPVPKPSETFAARPEPNDEARRHNDDMPTDEDIRMRAYHRYLERGGGHGLDFDDWLEAEKELRDRTSITKS